MKRILTGTLALTLLALALAGCSGKDYSEQELFTKAQQAQEAQEHKEAVRWYGKIVEAYPESDRAAKAQFMIGFIHANSMLDTSAARAAYQTFLTEFSSVADSGMVASAEWELRHLGQDVESIDEVMGLMRDDAGEQPASE